MFVTRRQWVTQRFLTQPGADMHDVTGLAVGDTVPSPSSPGGVLWCRLCRGGVGRVVVDRAGSVSEDGEVALHEHTSTFPPIQRNRVKKIWENPPHHKKIAFSNIINRSLASLANTRVLYFTIFLCILYLIMFDNLYRNIILPVFYSISLHLIMMIILIIFIKVNKTCAKVFSSAPLRWRWRHEPTFPTTTAYYTTHS